MTLQADNISKVYGKNGLAPVEPPHFIRTAQKAAYGKMN
jgi:hypothetical protein